VLDLAGSCQRSDGRALTIIPSDSLTAAPLVSATSDTLLVGGTAVTSPASGNLAVGRFSGAGGYQVAWALRSGYIRIVDPYDKLP
jgi:hypothetical protein